MSKPGAKTESAWYTALEVPEPASEYESDVLLIADEPTKRPSRRNGRTSARPDGSVQPLDMESVVRKLIALLSEDAQP